jgi:hypothetical protein
MSRLQKLVRSLAATAVLGSTAVAWSQQPGPRWIGSQDVADQSTVQQAGLRRIPVAYSEQEPAEKRPEKSSEELPNPKQDPIEALIKSGVLPPASTEEAQVVVPTTPDHSYEAKSEGAFDAVGSYEDPSVTGPRRRPMYPYGHERYWYGHDANVEGWGDLLELPHVRLGWFADAEATVFRPHVNGSFNSGTHLDGTFPGNPVTLGPGGMDWNFMPKIELGYRFEHGLGELRGAYRYLGASGTDPLPSFDSAGQGTQFTNVRLDIFDFDFYGSLEFNAEGLPRFFMLLLDPGRLGLGKPATPGLLVPPLEMRWFFGARAVNFTYDTVGRGDLLQEHVGSRFQGAGFHFGIDLNQRLPIAAPLFLHVRTEGAGIYGLMSQQFSRTVTGGPSASGGFAHDGVGVPVATLELGVAWVPHWPSRDVRVTFAYQYEEWFSWAQTSVTDTNADLILNGMLVRGEWKF